MSNWWPGASNPAQSNAGRRLTGHADLDVGRSVAGEDRHEPVQQVIAQFFGHALAANHGVHREAVPADAVAVSLVEQVLDKRRVTQDQVAVARPEEAQGRENLSDVRPG